MKLSRNKLTAGTCKFGDGNTSFIGEQYNIRHPCLQAQSNLIKCMVVAVLKVVHNLSVIWSKLYFIQTLVHLKKIEATVSDILSIFKIFI